MYYNEIKEAAKQPALLTSIAATINPATIVPAIAIGITGIVIYKAVKSLKSENKKLREEKEILADGIEYYEAECEEIDYSDEPYEEPSDNGTETVNSTVPATVAEPLNPTAENYSESYSSNGTGTVENMTDEELKKEMIRQAMSELGKRSAAKRGKKEDQLQKS